MTKTNCPVLPRLTLSSLRLGAVLLLSLGAVERVAAATVEERLDELERKLGALTQENAALKKQLGYDAAGKPGPAFVVAQGKEMKLALGGFLHFQGETGDAADSRFPANDRFVMRRMRLGARGSFSPVFDFSMQADFGANSLGASSGYRVQATDIFVLWKGHPAANVTVGQFKTPFGYEFLLADVRTASIERSLVSDQLALGRQAGAMLSGTFLEQKLSYAAAIVNGNGANNSGNDNEDFTYVGRLAATAYAKDGVKLSFGANAFTGEDTGSFTGRRTGQGVDMQIALPRAEVIAELLRVRFDRPAGLDYEASGWMLQGSYSLVPNRWLAMARYESYDPSDVARGDRTDLITLGFSYLIKGDDLKLSLNYLIGNPPGADDHVGRALARLQVIF